MVEPVRELIGGNLDIPRIYRKEDRAVTVEKALIAEARLIEEKAPSAELL